MSNTASGRIRTRESNFELLRIVCMFMIVWNHFFTYGPWQDAGVNSYLAHIFSFGKAGVDIFVMISGWFLVNSKFKSKSALRILGQGLLYGTAFGIAATIKGGSLHSNNFVLQFFIRSYLVLYLLFPFLNKIANGITRGQYRALLIILFSLFSILPLIIAIVPKGLGSQLKIMILGDESSPVFFCGLYLLAGYLRIYGLPKTSPLKLLLASLISLLAVRGLWCLHAAGLIILPSRVTNIVALDHDGTFILNILLAVGFFCAFASAKVPHNPLINSTAACTLGVLLIHDSAVVRRELWEKFAYMASWNPTTFLGGSLVVTLGVFAICALVDYLRGHIARVIPCPTWIDNKCRVIDASINGTA